MLDFIRWLKSRTLGGPTFSPCALAKEFLDRQNTNRVLELYTQLIHQYGHALFISNLLFNSKHQQSKLAMAKESNDTEHITAVHEVLGRDWFQRPFDSWAVY